jgi:L-alanine-DL-glutamate epimerase-like enolase superfamily enzyme
MVEEEDLEWWEEPTKKEDDKAKGSVKPLSF